MVRAKPKRSVVPMPDWLPDWRDVSQYPETKTTTLRQWAWEFLRRNPEYREQWDETIAPWIGSDGGFDNEASMAAERQKLDRDPKYKKREKEFQKKWHSGIRGDIKKEIERMTLLHLNPLYEAESAAFGVTSPAKLLQDKFSISSVSMLIPPSIPSSELPRDFHFTNNLGSIVCYDHPGKEYYALNIPYVVNVPIENHNQIYVFDLGLQIEPQIKSAKKYLKYSQKLLKDHGELKVKTSRNSSPKLYQRYLQLLDGKTIGASYREMAKIFYPGCTAIDGVNLKVRDALRAAERIRNIDYKFIPRAVK